MKVYTLRWRDENDEEQIERFADYYDALDLKHELEDNGLICDLQRVVIAKSLLAV